MDKTPQDSSPEVLLKTAIALYLVLAVCRFILGALQWVLGFSTGIAPGTEWFRGGFDVDLVGNGPGLVFGSIIDVVIPVLLLRGSSWGWKLAFAYAAIGAPALLLTSGLNWVSVPISSVYVIGGVLVLLAWFRGEI